MKQWLGKGWVSASNVLTLANWELHTLGYYWELIIPLSTLPYCSVDGGEKEREIYILFSVPAADLASPGPQDQSTIPRHTANHIVILLCCTLSTNTNFLQIYHPSR